MTEAGGALLTQLVQCIILEHVAGAGNVLAAEVGSLVYPGGLGD